MFTARWATGRLSTSTCPPPRRASGGKEALRGDSRGKETVLLVDDEATILEVMEKALTLSGYKVMVARGGEEAVEVYKKNHDRIDVVILDMIMPGMDGGKVFDLLREIHPGVKVILSSGYSIMERHPRSWRGAVAGSSKNPSA